MELWPHVVLRVTPHRIVVDAVPLGQHARGNLIGDA